MDSRRAVGAAVVRLDRHRHAAVVGWCNLRFHRKPESEYRNIQSSCHQIQSHQCFCIGAEEMETMENGISKGHEIELLEIGQI